MKNKTIKTEQATLNKVIENPTDYFFCYKSEKASLYSLVNRSLRFSPLGKLNDPIENTLQTFFLDPDTRFTKDKIDEGTDLLRNYTKKYCDEYIKVLCFTLSNNLDRSNLLSQSHMGYMRFSMWAQYADTGKGICLILEKNKLESEFKNLIKNENIFGKHGSVKYTEDYNHGMAFRIFYDELNSLKNGVQILKPKIDKYYKEYFFKKRMDWSMENEYRFVIISDRVQHIDITNSITGIIFGYNASQELISLVNKLELLKNVPKAIVKLQGYHAYINGL